MVEALYNAWEEFYPKIHQDEDDTENKKLEVEKKINDIVLHSWSEQFAKQLTKPTLNLSGDCTSYNIHQETNQNLDLKEVTLWRLALKSVRISDIP